MKLVERVKALLLTPGPEWQRIDHEASPPWELMIGYVACLAAIPSIADLVGLTAIGFELDGSTLARVDVLAAFAVAMFDYAASFAIVGVLAIAINLLAPLFGAPRDLHSALRLAVYAYTPAWLAGVFLILPGLHFLLLLGLFGLYLLFKGLPVLMRLPKEKAFPFAGAITVCAAGIVLVVGAVRASVFSLPGIL
jgi:hypothetical protein